QQRQAMPHPGNRSGKQIRSTRARLNAPSHPEAQSRPRPEPSQPVCRTGLGPWQKPDEARHERLFHRVVLDNEEPVPAGEMVSNDQAD
ncbi:MAG: hypothetical protein V3U11_02715, partial [Planctomycetota bacterium]